MLKAEKYNSWNVVMKTRKIKTIVRIEIAYSHNLINIFLFKPNVYSTAQILFIWAKTDTINAMKWWSSRNMSNQDIILDIVNYFDGLL